jgi:DNA-binding NarL/FixJ family response regulator
VYSLLENDTVKVYSWILRSRPGPGNLVEDMPRILIAEDRASMRHTLRNLFTLYSKWDVCGEAVDGQQAVDAAIALKPDLVLLDYKMPNADGVQAASEIRQKLPEMPVVIFTLYKTAELESQARQAGVRAVVGKEEGVIKLLNTIEDQLTRPLM